MASANTLLKLCLGAGALLAGAGIGYYYGVFLPGQAIRETVAAGEERQAKAAERQAAFARTQAAKAQREQAAQQRYQSCLGNVELTYADRWSAACRTQHARQQAAFEDCADDWFRTREGCAREFPVEPDQGCALPGAIGNRLAAARDAAKGQCLGELQGGM